jgi:hypothetical protein
MLAAAKRPLGSQGQFTVTGDVSQQVVNEIGQTTVVVRDMRQLDGEYVLLVTPPASVPNCMSWNLGDPQTLSNKLISLSIVPKSDREAKGYRKRGL